MTRLELLASQLDAQALPHELGATQQIFTDGIEFWQLCIEAKRLIIESKTEEPKTVKTK